MSECPTPNTRPVWLLDVDGVINVRQPLWGGERARDQAKAGKWAYTIQWAPPLAARIRELVVRNLVEVRWCTTWCAYAERIEALLQLPELGRCWTDDINGHEAAEAKLAAARAVLAEGRRLIWTDDSEVPGYGPVYDELTADGRALLIRPQYRYGLEPVDLQQIEAFCRADLDGQ